MIQSEEIQIPDYQDLLKDSPEFRDNTRQTLGLKGDLLNEDPNTGLKTEEALIYTERDDKERF